MNRHVLVALDAQNPLAYFAALGLLRILDHYARRRGTEPPRLSFVDEGRPTPVLETSESFDDLIGLVVEDASALEHDPIIAFAYTEEEGPVAPDRAGAIRDLKPPPKVARAFLDSVAGADRRVSDLAAGLFSDLVRDNNGNTKPTAFHFTAGQQEFLSMVDELRRGVRDADVRDALLEPWTNHSPLPSLAWDASVARDYALRARNPSTEKRGSVPAANWLAFHALAFFSVFARRTRLVTTAVVGGWKDSTFSWPLWDARLSRPVIASLLRLGPGDWSAAERKAHGVTTVLRSRILRSDQGGYGSFSPAEVVLPSSRRPEAY